MSLVIQREVDLSDHTVMFVVHTHARPWPEAGPVFTGRSYEVHCDRCGGFVVHETEDDARRFGEWCGACDCEACEGTGEVSSGDYYDDAPCDGDIPCPQCFGTGSAS